jgi:hypothetical protein
MPDPFTSSSTSPRAKASGAAKARRASTAAKARSGAAASSRRRSTSRKPAPTRAATATSRRGRTNRSTTELVGDYAERAVLIPVGAALIARERVLTSVTDTISSYSTPSKAQSQLRKFERRGGAARTRLEREVRRTRTKVERELRERRRELERRRERLTKSVTARVEQTQAQLEKTQSQIEDALRTRLEDGADLASRVQERVLNLV